MYLNDGDLNRDKIAEFKSAKNLLNYLVSSRNMVADIIINNQKKIASSIATFSVDSGYVVASVDIRIAFDKLVDFNAIEINVHPANEPNSVYVSSYTDGFSEAIPANDVDADLYFKAGSLYPYNNLKFAIAESKFNSTRTQTMQTISYDKLPSVVDTDDPDDSDTNTGITVEPTTVQVTISTSAVLGSSEGGSEITSAVYKYDASSNTWQPNEWDSSLECNVNGANFIRVGVYNPMKKVSVAPADGVANIEVTSAADDDATNNIITETGAVAVYQINFIPTDHTTLIIDVQDVTEEP